MLALLCVIRQDMLGSLVIQLRFESEIYEGQKAPYHITFPLRHLASENRDSASLSRNRCLNKLLSCLSVKVEVRGKVPLK